MSLVPLIARLPLVVAAQKYRGAKSTCHPFGFCASATCGMSMKMKNEFNSARLQMRLLIMMLLPRTQLAPNPSQGRHLPFIVRLPLDGYRRQLQVGKKLEKLGTESNY